LPFTEKLLAALGRPIEGSRYVYDTLEAGLGVRLTLTRCRYVFYRWFRGKPEMLTLQEVGTVSLREIRRIVAGYRGDLAKGIDVFARERQLKTRQTPTTLQEAFDAHLARPDLRDVTRRKYRSLWRRVPRLLAHKPIADITSRELKRLHADIGARHQRTANLVLVILSLLLSENGRRFNNPADDVTRYRNRVRQRVLSLGELRRFRGALEQENALWRAFFLLLMLTGARRGALAQMRWRDLDLEAAVWRIPAEASKNHQVITIALPGEAAELLRRMAQERSVSPWVFPGGSRAGHVTNPTAAWQRICERAEIEQATPHDLRRTLGTMIAADGANAATIAAVLGHLSQSSAKAYIHLSSEIAREAIERAARRISRAA
jgi:integrase